MDDEREEFESLVARGATCFEFGWNGYVKLYSDEDPPCKCSACVLLNGGEGFGV